MSDYEIGRDHILFSRSGLEGEGETEDSALRLLRELLDNGLAERRGEQVALPHEVVATLTAQEAATLRLPEFYPFEIAIFAVGTIPEPEFAYRLLFVPHPLLPPFRVARVGAIVTLEGGESYRLTLPQLQLCASVESFNGRGEEERTAGNHFLHFARIRELAEHSHAFLDRYLANEQVVAPEKIGLRVERGAGDALCLSPEIEGVDQPQFERRFRFPRVREFYSLQDGQGHRTRVVFSEEQRKELEKIKRHARVTGKVKERLLEAPQAIFDPDLVDLDTFSERVVRIGRYKPRIYPFISPYKSEWIPGVVVETTPTERKRIRFPTKKTLERFEAAYESAKRVGAEEMTWEGVSLPLVEVPAILRIARERWHDPKGAAEKERGRKQPVLIIKENVETLEHTEGRASPSPSENTFVHRYLPVPGLRSGVRILDHQKEGIAWLQSLFLDRYGGALLADDMGLGKTFQILAFLAWHRKVKGGEGTRNLIVAPVSLLSSWEEEYVKFWEERMPLFQAYGRANSFAPEGKQREGIVLTTYETLRGRQLEFCAIDWDVVVLDEAQKIKRPGTLVTNAAKALKSAFKIAVTGTPVENTLVDLWCICDFLVPGLLGSAKSFAQTYQHPLKRKDTDIEQLGDRLRKEIGIHIKRRLKENVLSALPKKEILCRPGVMPPAQEARYLQVSKEARREESGERQRMLGFLLKLRQISDHPALLDRNIEAIPIEALIAASAKLQETLRCLEEIRDRGEKVILFTEYRKTQRLLARLLRLRFGVEPSIIHGEMPVRPRRGKESRLEAVARFQAQEGFHAIVISPLAAGVGLNITKANNVIHYTRTWNPAREEQATDRVYRIGQKRPVHVYLPMATSKHFRSFDLLLHELLERKRALARVSLFPTERVEVSPVELFDALASELPAGPFPPLRPLSIEDLDTLEPSLFEAAIAELWARGGREIHLTPRPNDHGADVIVLEKDSALLLQVKSLQDKAGVNVVGELLHAREFYQSNLRCSCALGIVTNRLVTKGVRERCRQHGIAIFDRSWLRARLAETPLDPSRIERWEAMPRRRFWS